MKTVRVNKSELIKILYENRKKHKREYKESIRAYRVKAVDLFNQELQKAVSGKAFKTVFDLSKPECHEKDYDLIIKMIEMSIDDILEMDQQEFSQLVNDEWTWKSSFRSSVYSNSGYSGYSGISGYSGSIGFTTDGNIGVSTNLPATFVEVTFSEDEQLEE